MARTNNFPTFKPTDMQLPPSEGFQPATIIMANQINSSSYMSYNFVNSFVDALIDMGNLDDSTIYSYGDTDLATKIKGDFNGWFNNQIDNYNFTKIEISEQVDEYAKLTINGLDISNADRQSSLFTYNQLSFTDDKKSFTMMADHLSWNDGNGNSSYLNLTNLTYLVSNTTINFLPSTIKSSTSTQSLKCVYAKEFLNSDYSTFADLKSAVTSFITSNYGKLTILNISASIDNFSEDVTLIARKYGGVLSYFYLAPENMSSTSTYIAYWTLVKDFATLAPSKITVTFC